jgi:hypothetical protein
LLICHSILQAVVQKWCNQYVVALSIESGAETQELLRAVRKAMNGHNDTRSLQAVREKLRDTHALEVSPLSVLPGIDLLHSRGVVFEHRD